MKKYLLLVLFIGLFTKGHAQVFEQIDDDFIDVIGQTKWFDIDSDGDLDLFVSGQGYENRNNVYSSKIYMNEGLDAFSEYLGQAIINNSLFSSNIELGDYDNDGDLDFLISGYGNDPDGYHLKILENRISENELIEEIVTLTDYKGKAAWVDYDLDGDLDVLLFGSKYVSGSGGGYFYKSVVFKNKGGSFSEILIETSDVFVSDLKCIDFDLDGDLDFLITGRNSDDTKGTYLYENILGEFAKVMNLEMEAGEPGSISVGDYNADGYPDFVTLDLFRINILLTHRYIEIIMEIPL